MRRITLYILRQLAIGTVVVTAGLLCILWLSQSLRLVELIVTRGVSITTFLELTGLLLPSLLPMILPIALFAVVLFTYNRLSGDRELIVLRAAGMSPLAIGRPALVLALLLTAAGYGLTLWAAPASVRAFREMNWSVRHDLTRVLVEEGAFTRVAPGVTVYVRGRTPAGELEGILVHDTRVEARASTLMAERGALLQTDEGARVVMVNGSRQEVEKGTGRLSLLHFERYSMDFALSGKAAEDRFRDARERPLGELLTTQAGSGEGAIGASEIRRFRIEAHQRLTGPLLSVSFTLIALAALLTGPFNRRGTARRLLGAVAAMVVAEMAAVGAGNLAGGSTALVPVLYAAVLLPGVAAFVLLARPELVDRLLAALPRRAAGAPGSSTAGGTP